ncbi:hypothetical protein [Streptomonospora wellingtoniae]|uniref:DUF2530 domain-containing protein n=1 Tax=Streptomonospora wellingtoniae TaxID=3075544 RepID=A0ABU2KT93_9ACTN|nr:hypothetical protein [Streptomonospora sp. DSM 45055]MDT0302475.1 hypothetical protein [Streptomonospora sp. DSM 45055]
MKPVSAWETVMWVCAAVALVSSGITAAVQDNPIGAWVSLVVAAVIAVAAGAERRRVLQRRDRA